MPFKFLNGASRAAPVTWHRGLPINRRAFLETAAALAEELDETSHVVNLCSDRFAFLTTFAAALARRRVTLLPADTTCKTLDALCAAYDAPVAIADEPAAHLPMPVIRWTPERRRGALEIALADDQPAVIVHTSGSSGAPRPHVKRWGELAGRARHVGERLELDGVDNIVSTVPSQHMYGLENAVMLALQTGLAVQPHRPLFSADVAESLDAHSLLVTTPIHLESLLAEGAMAFEARMILSSTAPLSVDIARAAEARFNAHVMEIYGSTETGVVATRRPALTSRWRLLPGLSLRQDDSATCLVDGIGVCEVELNDHVEPLGRSGFLLRGRAADIIKIAGKRASLAALNETLCALDGVVDGVFVPPVQDEGRCTKRLAAFVVAPGLAPADIRGRLREQIDTAFLPRPLIKLDALPRNAIGKLPQASLRALAKRHTRAS